MKEVSEHANRDKVKAELMAREGISAERAQEFIDTAYTEEHVWELVEEEKRLYGKIQ